jgi:hypothetical protein
LLDDSPGISGIAIGKMLTTGDMTWSSVMSRGELVFSAAAAVGVGLNRLASFNLSPQGDSLGDSGTRKGEALTAGDI